MPQRNLVIPLCLLFAGSAAAASSVTELQALLAQENYAAAAQSGEQLLRQNGGHTQTRFLTAYAYQMNRQKNKAIALYQALIEDRPSLPEPRNNLAMIYLDDGDYDRASQLLVDAINTHPSYATAYDNLSQIYKGIASEAYRRAVSESSEPAKYTHNIRLSAITRLDSIDQDMPAEDGGGGTPVIELANRETLLMESVQLWARAWSDKDFAAYTDFYASQYRARFDTREQWVAYRRSRIMRPGDIRVQVSDLEIRWHGDNLATVDFRQDFDSPGYGDRVRKRLAFERVGSRWKITEERVLSVL